MNKSNKKRSTLLSIMAIVIIGLFSLTGCSLATNGIGQNCYWY